MNRRESDHLLEKYGEESYFFNKLLEKTVFNIPETFLLNHKITSIVRTRMIDWMIEVCSAFYFMDETFFLSVNILDKFLQKAKKIYNNKKKKQFIKKMQEILIKKKIKKKIK